jgi:hypothetical protein
MGPETLHALAHTIKILIPIFVTGCVVFYYVCSAVLHAQFAGLLASSQYPEGPATGHLGTGFSFFSLCLKANAVMVPKIPSCYCMLLM